MSSISFKSAGHALATFFKAAKADVVKYTPEIVAAITGAEATKTEVEVGTAAVLGAIAPVYVPVAESIEDAGYAVLGEIVNLINAGGAAAEANLVNAGFDKNVIATAKAVAGGATQVATLVKAAA